MKRRRGIVAAIIGALGLGGLLAWLGGRKKVAAPAPAPAPVAEEAIPVIVAPAAGARLAVNVAVPVGSISWGGLLFPDGGTWRGHVRPIYGGLFVEGQDPRVLLAALARENETATHLQTLNAVHLAFNFPEAFDLIAQAVAIEGMPVLRA